MKEDKKYKWDDWGEIKTHKDIDDRTNEAMAGMIMFGLALFIISILVIIGFGIYHLITNPSQP